MLLIACFRLSVYLMGTSAELYNIKSRVILRNVVCFTRVSRVPAHNELTSVCFNGLTVVSGPVEGSDVDYNKSH
jgi:hypothetical protein